MSRLPSTVPPPARGRRESGAGLSEPELMLELGLQLASLPPLDVDAVVLTGDEATVSLCRAGDAIELHVALGAVSCTCVARIRSGQLELEFPSEGAPVLLSPVLVGERNGADADRIARAVRLLRHVAVLSGVRGPQRRTRSGVRWRAVAEEHERETG